MCFRISDERSKYYIYYHLFIGIIIGMFITFTICENIMLVIPNSEKKNFSKNFSNSISDEVLLEKVSNYIDTEDKKVILGGQNLYLESQVKGALVTGISRKDIDIQINDIIFEVNNQNFSNLDEFMNIISTNGINVINFQVKRGEKIFYTSLYPKKINDSYDVGFKVTQYEGNATITFYDKENNKFALAGHELKLVNNNYQDVSIFDFFGITKSVTGTIGSIDGKGKNEKVGTIFYTDFAGAYGYFNKDVILDNKMYVEIGKKDELKEGKATIYCSLDNEKPKAYDVMISYNDENDNQKYFKIKFTDPDLIKKTGGGIGGMSGTPVLQDGKIVGAISTVDVNDPTIGHAIYIDYMVASMYNIK